MKQCYTDKNGHTFYEGDKLVIDTNEADLWIVNLPLSEPITEDTVFTFKKIGECDRDGDMWIYISHLSPEGKNLYMPLKWVKKAPLTFEDFEDCTSISIDFGECEEGFEEEPEDEGRESFFYQVRDTLDDLILDGHNEFEVTIKSWRDGEHVLTKRIDTLYYDEEVENDE